jgi:hypothetical protein
MAQMLSGRGEEARHSARELLRLDPQFTVSRFLTRSPSAQYPIGQLCARALRDAGVPE